MENLNNKEIIIEVIDEIMTDMFFIFADLDDEGNQITEGIPQSDSIHVGIHFNTDFYLHFNIDRALLEEMAENFLGIDDAITEKGLLEMACETANIIGGNYLVKVDPSSMFKLSIPEILDPNKIKEPERPENIWEISFVSDGRVLTISPYKR